MNRRNFLLLFGGAVVAPRALRAQQKAMPVIGYLIVFFPPPNLNDLDRGPVRRGLSETGFVEGRNMVSEYRWAEGDYNRLPALAADLVSRKVDLIVTRRHPSGTSSEGRNLDDPYRIRRCRRSGRDRPRRQSRSSGRQPYRLQHLRPS